MGHHVKHRLWKGNIAGCNKFNTCLAYAENKPFSEVHRDRIRSSGHNMENSD